MNSPISRQTWFKVRFPVIVALPIFLSIAPARAASSDLCQQVFAQSLRATNEDIWAKDSMHSYSTEPTVQMLPYLVNYHGTHLRFLTRTGPFWNSRAEPIPRAFLGDPRRMIHLLGTKAARLFGFRLLSKQMMIVPDADTLNRGIEKLNSILPLSERIPVRFENPIKDRVSQRQFLIDFAERLVIPLAKAGPLALHDLSFHSATLLIPREDLLLAQKQIQLFFEFEQFMDRHHPTVSRQTIVREFFHKSIQLAAIGLDAGTGNYGVILKDISPYSSRNVNESDQNTKLNYNSMIQLHGAGHSPIHWVYSTIEGALLEMQISNPNEHTRLVVIFREFKDYIRNHRPDGVSLFEDSAVINLENSLSRSKKRIQLLRSFSETLVDMSPHNDLSQTP